MTSGCALGAFENLGKLCPVNMASDCKEGAAYQGERTRRIEIADAACKSAGA